MTIVCFERMIPDPDPAAPCDIHLALRRGGFAPEQRQQDAGKRNMLHATAPFVCVLETEIHLALT